MSKIGKRTAFLLAMAKGKPKSGVEVEERSGSRLFRRRHVVPFVLSVAILACDQSTGLTHCE